MKKSSLIFYLLIIIISIGFFSFFGEGLPRFWYDDISHYEVASKTPYLSLLMEIADFTRKGFDMRVTSYLLSKFYLDFFGENLYLYRLTKILAVSAGICMLAFLLERDGVKKAVILLSFLVYLTSPVLMIGTTWIVILGTWSLFFKVLTVFIFFHLYRDEKKKAGFYILSAVLIVVMMFGVKAREDFTLIPFVALAFLLFRRQRSFHLYLIAIASIIIVFPYYVFSWSGEGLSSRFHLLNLKMFNVYLRQIAMFVPFLFYSIYLLVRKKIRLNDMMVFSLLWVMFEIGMIFFYPSDEMRYLESLILSSIFFFAAVIDSGFRGMPAKGYAAALLMFFLLTGYRVYENVRWDYNFRGSFGSFFIAVDKQMKYINERFNNSLCLYRNFTLLYYDWKTTNHYVNLNPNNSWGRKFDDFYKLHMEKDGGVSIEIINPERFDHIFLLDNSLPVREPGVFVIFEGNGNTLFDCIQNRFGFNIRETSLYNTKFGREIRYPVTRRISILK